jgi:ankyrin repeat protein
MKSQRGRAEDKIFGAVLSGDIAAVSAFLTQGSDVNARDRAGRTPLMNSIIDQNQPLVVFLLEKGADVNLLDSQQWSALHFAAQVYSESLVKTLLAHGASVDSRDAHGNTPLWRAVFESKNRGGVIEILLAAGADRDLKNNHGSSPLDLAKTIANYDAMQFFS